MSTGGGTFKAPGSRNRFSRRTELWGQNVGIEQEFVSGKRVLVLGVTGLFGRGLSYLLSKNNEVHGLDIFPHPRTEREVSGWCARLWKVDCSQRNCLRDMPKDFDVVFNLAVQWGHGQAWDWNTFEQMALVNSFLPGQVMEHFGGSGAKLVFGSTGGCYVASKDRSDLHREGVTMSQGGGHPYDDTKLGGEMLVKYFSREHGIPAVILRYYWPAAPYHDGGRAGRAYRAYMAGKPTQVSRKNPWYHNVGYISDLLYATCAAANHTAAPAALYNVSGSEIVSYRDVDLAVAEELGIEPIFEEVEQERDMPMYLADVARMSRELWKPRIGLRQCVRRCVRAVKEGIRTPRDWMFEC